MAIIHDIIVWATAMGGGKSRPSPPREIPPNYFCYIGGIFATFSSHGGLIVTFFLLWGLFHHVGPFLLLFTPCLGPFLGLPPPPYKNVCGRPCIIANYI